jgi:hypothetical protein
MMGWNCKTRSLLEYAVHLPSSSFNDRVTGFLYMIIHIKYVDDLFAVFLKDYFEV